MNVDRWETLERTVRAEWDWVLKPTFVDQDRMQRFLKELNAKVDIIKLAREVAERMHKETFLPVVQKRR